MILRGRDLYVQYNGEVLGKMDKVELKVVPRALSVLAPEKK
jgi:diacylglycerol kinase family enzyme